MSRKSTFYFSRVVKLGAMRPDNILAAIRESTVVESRDFSWSFADFSEGRSEDGTSWVFARLCKFKPEGETSVFDETSRRVVDAEVENQAVAEAAFVWIPSESMLASQHIWNKIEYRTFVARFVDLVREGSGAILSEVELDPVSELASLSERLKLLKRISRLQAKVRPPNPLFGRFWKPLRDYVRGRRLEEMRVDERAKSGEGMPSSVTVIIANMAERESNGPGAQSTESTPPTPEATAVEDDIQLPEPIAIGDMAFLMAADGYGEGLVEGSDQADRDLVVRTRDAQRSFKFDSSPEPDKLAERALSEVRTMNFARGLEHPVE